MLAIIEKRLTFMIKSYFIRVKYSMLKFASAGIGHVRLAASFGRRALAIHGAPWPTTKGCIEAPPDSGLPLQLKEHTHSCAKNMRFEHKSRTNAHRVYICTVATLLLNSTTRAHGKYGQLVRGRARRGRGAKGRAGGPRAGRSERRRAGPRPTPPGRSARTRPPPRSSAGTAWPGPRRKRAGRGAGGCMQASPFRPRSGLVF